MTETSEVPLYFDELLCSVLSSGGDIANFLDTVFGFLYRRTDFFVLQQGPKSRMGFLPGVAEQILLSTFRKWQIKASKSKNEEVVLEKTNPKIVNPAEILSKDKGTKSSTSSNPAAVIQSGKSSAFKETSGGECQSNGSVKNSCNPVCVPASASVPRDCSQRLDKAGETYNGAYHDEYWWTQSMTDIDVCVTVPSNIKKGNQIKVTAGPLDFVVKVKDDLGSDTWRTLIEDKLSSLCNKEDTIWSLDTDRHIIQLHLEKSRDKWWDQLLVSEPKINMRQIEATRPFAELSEEEQTTVSNLMMKERLKQEAKERGDVPAPEPELNELIQKVGDSKNLPPGLAAALQRR